MGRSPFAWLQLCQLGPLPSPAVSTAAWEKPALAALHGMAISGAATPSDGRQLSSAILSRSSDVSSVTACNKSRSSACLLSSAMFLPKSKLTWFDASRRQRDIASAAAVIPASFCRAWRSVSSMGVASCRGDPRTEPRQCKEYEYNVTLNVCFATLFYVWRGAGMLRHHQCANLATC